MSINKRNTLTISDRDLRAIYLVAQLDDRELFGLECFIAGTRAGRELGNKMENGEKLNKEPLFH